MALCSNMRGLCALMLAFVDLFIAFLLLWFAALTFSSQTIIGPFNSLLIRLESFLLDHSTRKISTVHRTVCRLLQFEGELLELGISRRHELTEAESFHGPTMSRRESTLSTYSVSGDVSSSLLNDSETGDKTEVNLEDENPTRNLKRALKEEKTAHAKLGRELEAERRATETAAFETMAKIAFLQEEKANIEREARQYRIEQGGKSKYKDDQIENLEEKLIDRDRQIYIMEKENEAYRQILKERGLNSSVDIGVELRGGNDGSSKEFQEKGMVRMIPSQRFPSHDNNSFKLDSNYNNDVHIISNGQFETA